MRSKIAQKILDETPKEVSNKVRRQAELLIKEFELSKKKQKVKK